LLNLTRLKTLSYDRWKYQKTLTTTISWVTDFNFLSLIIHPEYYPANCFYPFSFHFIDKTTIKFTGKCQLALSELQKAGSSFKEAQSLARRPCVKYILLEATALVKLGI
jgi:hypothetical protein